MKNLDLLLRRTRAISTKGQFHFGFEKSAGDEIQPSNSSYKYDHKFKLKARVKKRGLLSPVEIAMERVVSDLTADRFINLT